MKNISTQYIVAILMLAFSLYQLSLPDFWEFGVYNLADLQEYAPPTTYAPVQLPEAKVDPAAAGLVGALAGVGVGAAGVSAYRALSKSDDTEEDSVPEKEE